MDDKDDLIEGMTVLALAVIKAASQAIEGTDFSERTVLAMLDNTAGMLSTILYRITNQIGAKND